jgi:hypothetical protein
MWKLVRSINLAAEPQARDERSIESVFGLLWPHFEKDAAPHLRQLNQPGAAKDGLGGGNSWEIQLSF